MRKRIVNMAWGVGLLILAVLIWKYYQFTEEAYIAFGSGLDPRGLLPLLALFTLISSGFVLFAQPIEPAPKSNAASLSFSDVVKRLFNFSGRATRREYALIFLGQLAAVIIMMLFASLIRTGIEGPGEVLGYILYGIMIILSLPIAAAAALRRLHDIGRSGWWLLLLLVPVLNLSIFLVCLFLPGKD